MQTFTLPVEARQQFTTENVLTFSVTMNISLVMSFKHEASPSKSTQLCAYGYVLVREKLRGVQAVRGQIIVLQARDL